MGEERLTLQSAGVRDDLPGMVDKTDGGLVAHREGQDDIFIIVFGAQPLCTLVIARMHRVDGRRVQGIHGRQDVVQLLVRVGILLPVAGHIVEFPGHIHLVALKVHNFLQLAAVQPCGIIAERVVHGITHHGGIVHQSLPLQKCHAGIGAGQIDGGQMIGHDAVDLFRIVQRPKTRAGFHMAHRDQQLHSSQCRCHGGIGVTKNQHHVRLFLQKHLFDGNQHIARHLAMGAAGDAQIVIGSGDVHFFEKHFGHIVVIVLSGVDQYLLEVLAQHP